MKEIILLFLSISLCSAFSSINVKDDKVAIENVLNNWHKAAAECNAKNYFDAMTEDAVFIGTDASENWNKKDFIAFAKPFFDKGKAWDFKRLQRHIYIAKDQKTAWFDELLDTWMGVCRGSGVMVKIGSQWKIQQYVLSLTVPNANTDAVIKIKEAHDEALKQQLKNVK